jgi:hypothetical protein
MRDASATKDAMRFNLDISKRELAIWCGSWCAAIALVVGGWMFWASGTNRPANAVAFGWSPEAEADHEPLAAAMPAFQLVDADGNAVVQANEKANVRLWHATLKVHGKHHINVAQEGNDCTAQAAKHAVELLQDIEITNTGGTASDCRLVAAHYIYGRSRHPDDAPAVRREGCSGAYTAKCVMEGVLAADTPGLPSYSGQIVRQWGNTGPPRKWITEAKKFPIKQTSPCRNASEIRDAVCNLYPVTIASNVGFDRIEVRDNRRVGVRSGQWPHQMLICGYDGQTGREPYYYVYNSWGPTAHGSPLGDEPPGGFWITERDMEAIAAQRACFAYSSFVGFTARVFHFDLFSHKLDTDHTEETDASRSILSASSVSSVSHFHERPSHEIARIPDRRHGLAVDLLGHSSRATLRLAGTASGSAKFALGL